MKLLAYYAVYTAGQTAEEESENPWYAVTAYSVASLRAAGFEGDVVVVSDRTFDCPGAAVRVRPDLFPTLDFAALRITKPTALAAIPELDEYDAVLYTDADIQFEKNPDALFQSALDHPDRLSLFSKRALSHSWMALTSVTLAEVPEEIRKPWHAGIFAATPATLRDAMEKLHTRYMENDYDRVFAAMLANPEWKGLTDEQTLIDLILLQEIVPHEWPHEWFGHVGAELWATDKSPADKQRLRVSARSATPEATLWHHCGFRREHMGVFAEQMRRELYHLHGV